MLETGSPADDNLALLYARGELDGEDVAAFERRLGESQALRDTLCRAVELLQGGGPPGRAYRARVRYRLRQSRHGQRRAALSQHPALWALFGAAVALVTLFLLPPGISPCHRCAHRAPDQKPSPPPETPGEEAPPKGAQMGADEQEYRRLVHQEADSSLGDSAPMVQH